MVQVQYKWLLNPKFIEVMRKIADHRGFPSIKESYNASKLVEKLEQELRIALKQRQALVEKFSAEEGAENVSEEDQKTKQKAWEEEITKLGEHTVALEKREQINVDHLEGLKLSPSDILILNNIVDFSSAAVTPTCEAEAPLSPG